MADDLQKEPGQSDAVPEVLADGTVADHELGSNLLMGSHAMTLSGTQPITAEGCSCICCIASCLASVKPAPVQTK